MTAVLLGVGPDSYIATTAGDQIFGGGGADTLTASAGGNQLFGDAGDDVLNGAAGNDYLSGGSDPGLTEHNVLHGYGGDDTIVSNSFGDQIYGGAGDDQVQINALRTGQIVDGGTGTDTLMLMALSVFTQPIFIQMGSTFQPSVGGVAGATYVNFENLYVVGGSGSNSITGGAGNDTIMNSFSNVSTFQGGALKGGAGTDEISFYGLAAAGTGTMLADGGKGTADSLIWGNGLAFFGALDIDATAGTMTADGTIFAHFTGFEAVKIQTFFGATGTVAFTGGAEVDTLDIYASASTGSTGDGNDVVILHSGQGDLHAGLGDDRVTVDFANSSTQNLWGDSGNDSLFGGGGQATLTGGDGNDNLSTFNGRSHLFGGAGDDTLYLSASYSIAGTGPAVLAGGAGRDVLTLEYSRYTDQYIAVFSAPSLVLVDGTQISGIEAITFSSGSGNDNLTASNDVAGKVANKLLGNGGEDTLHGSSAGASLYGGVGNDHVLGGNGADYLGGDLGNDLLSGGNGADSLDGGFGNDVLRGGAGDDTLMGNYGKDVMAGGLGADRFVFTFASQTGKDAPSRDVIQDFTKADLDRIDLSAIDSDGNSANGKTAFHFIGAGSFSNTAGELRMQKVNQAGTVHDFTVVAGDTNGDGIADFQIEVRGLITFGITDFILI